MWLRQAMRAFRRWQGIVLVIAALVSTVWLAITNQLILYIHPRYIVFTVIMAAFGLVFVISSFVSRPGHDHDQDHEDGDESRSRIGKLFSVGATILTLVVAVGLVVVPPATLTTATADQRVINSTTVGARTNTIGSATPTGSFAKFTVLDWSSLLRQTTDASFYEGKAVDVVGFITKDPGDAANVFYVSRFVITCCAVDAQPVGVPVYQPNWQSGFKPDQWVRVTGSFDTNPSRKSSQPIALLPTKTIQVNQPREPYLY